MRKVFWIPIITFAVIILFWGIALCLAVYCIRDFKFNPFESLGVLFTGLAFGGLVINIVLQSSQIRANSKEMGYQSKLNVLNSLVSSGLMAVQRASARGETSLANEISEEILIYYNELRTEFKKFNNHKPSDI